MTTAIGFIQNIPGFLGGGDLGDFVKYFWIYRLVEKKLAIKLILHVEVFLVIISGLSSKIFKPIQPGLAIKLNLGNKKCQALFIFRSPITFPYKTGNASCKLSFPTII